MGLSNRWSRFASVATFIALWAAAVVGVIGNCRAAAAAEPRERCDALAAHPHDPGRYAPGVPDDQLAPGAAIEACELAVKLNPNEGRLWFELGRVYWNAQRDSEAFAAFVEAAKRNYRPAQKYIGDAYLEGRGLPPGESQNSDTAVEWYKRSCGKLCDPSSTATGFPDAQRALADLSEYLKKNRFDAAVFQNPDFITAIYNNKYDGVPVGPLFVYLNGFVEEIGGDKILYVDSDCKPLSTIATQWVTQLGALAAIVALGKPVVDNRGDTQSILNAVLGFGALTVYEDQGHRDAVNLVQHYRCRSKIAQTIMNNVVIKIKNPGDLAKTASSIIAPLVANPPTAPQSAAPASASGEIAFTNAPDNRLNLREGPGVQFAVVEELENGSKVRIVETTPNGWKKVIVELMGDTHRPPGGELTGFVNGKFLVASKPAER